MKTLRIALFLYVLLLAMELKAQKIESIKNGNVILQVKIFSTNHSEAVLLLHGGPGVPDDMMEVVSSLKDKYTVITFEQRGVGLSICDNCNFTMKDYISDIDSICEHLNINNFHLFGHSWGGLYAQIYAMERPERIKSLFLCSPSSGTNKIWKKTEAEVLQFHKNNTSRSEWFKMGWNSLLGMLGSDKAYRKLFRQVLNNYHRNYLNAEINVYNLDGIYSRTINRTRKEIVQYKYLSQFHYPEYPIIVMYGDNDIYGESKNDLINRFPTAKVEKIKNCGHIPWKHNPIEFEMILDEFYKKHI